MGARPCALTDHKWALKNIGIRLRLNEFSRGLITRERQDMAKKRRYCYDYPRPMVTTDCMVLRVHGQALEVILIKRKHAPYKGCWALPGGFIKMKEPIEAAAARELAEEAGLKDISFLIQLGAYGAPGRDPRGRVIAVAFVGIIEGQGSELKADTDASRAEWHPVEELPGKLAFDHPTIIGDGLHRLIAGGRTSGVLFAFLPDTFTEPALQDVLHAVYGVKLGPKAYLEPFLKMRIVRRAGRGKYRFVGWSGANRP